MPKTSIKPTWQTRDRQAGATADSAATASGDSPAADSYLRGLAERLRLLESSNARPPVRLQRFASSRCFCCDSDNLEAQPYPYTKDAWFADCLLLGCLDCGISWVPEVPFQLADYYAREYARSNRKDRGLPPEQYFARLQEDRKFARYIRRARRHATYLEELLPEAERVLDFGSGPGYFLFCVRHPGRTLLAVETDKSSHKYLRHLGAQLCSSLADVRPVDFVLASHSIEHFMYDEVKQTLSQLAASLQPSGIACVEVPVGSLTRHQIASRHAPHTLFFTAEALERLLLEAGFRTVHLGTTHGESLPLRRPPGYTPARFLELDGRGPIIAIASMREEDPRLRAFRSEQAREDRAAASPVRSARLGSLEREGFSVFRGVLSPSEAKTLAAALRQDGNLRASDRCTITDVARTIPASEKVITDPRIIAVARQALRSEVRFLQVADFIMNRNSPRWHRDCPARSFGRGEDWNEDSERFGCIKLVILLETDSFAFGFVPGSHRQPFAHPPNEEELPRDSYCHLLDDTSPERPIPLAQPTLVHARPGDCLVFDMRLYHRGFTLDASGNVTSQRQANEHPKTTINLCYGLENQHSQRFYSYYRFLRREIGYRELPDEVASSLRRKGLLLSSHGTNLFESKPEQAEGVFLPKRT